MYNKAINHASMKNILYDFAEYRNDCRRGAVGISLAHQWIIRTVYNKRNCNVMQRWVATMKRVYTGKSNINIMLGIHIKCINNNTLLLI